MEATHPTAGWEQVGDRFYRKTQLYTAVFDQDLELDNYIVAGAPYGGAIGTRVSHTSLVIAASPGRCWTRFHTCGLRMLLLGRGHLTSHRRHYPAGQPG